MSNTINLKEYQNKINKEKCPEKCEFKQKGDIEIVLVPYPDEILGIIVSRDPTIDWAYRYLKNESDENIRRKMLFASAIPLSLITKLQIFMRNDQIFKNDEKFLFDVVFQKTYWSHLHKCMTDATGKVSIKFKCANANRCATQWLEKELDFAINNKTRFIIALGKDVQSWIQKWKEKKNKNIEVISLPHSSGQNNPIWYRSQKDKYKEKIKNTEEEIRTLIKLCKGD